MSKELEPLEQVRLWLEFSRSMSLIRRGDILAEVRGEKQAKNPDIQEMNELLGAIMIVQCFVEDMNRMLEDSALEDFIAAALLENENNPEIAASKVVSQGIRQVRLNTGYPDFLEKTFASVAEEGIDPSKESIRDGYDYGFQWLEDLSCNLQEFFDLAAEPISDYEASEFVEDDIASADMFFIPSRPDVLH